MKTISMIGSLIAFPILLAAQTSNPVSHANASTTPAPTPYAVISRDANSAVWQRTIYEPAPGGKFMPHTERYVELASGLNHLIAGNWVPSSDHIAIAPDGTSASGTNGQVQAYFPGDIYNGVIRLITPDGKTITSQPIGLAYSDGSNSVLLAVVTNATGAILSSGNQVIYTNAFAGLDADLLYTYTKAGFQQDVVLREQPPEPGALGLNPTKTRLQIITEFFTSPVPRITARSVSTAAGNLENDTLSFGAMSMGQGKAFLVGKKTPSVIVEKHWMAFRGRQFLVEEVPIISIANDIDNLPPYVAEAGAGTKPMICKNLILPPCRPIHSSSKAVFLAQVTPLGRGLVLDYQTLNGSLTNYTFQGDTTYYISGPVDLIGTNTFEGGAVLKYATNTSVTLEFGSVARWRGGAYRPVVFTAKDDNTVGGTISGSSGQPLGYYANPALYFYLTSPTTNANFRIAWAAEAIENFNSQLSFNDGQLVNCGYGIQSRQSDIKLRNLLFANVQTNFFSLAYGGVDVQNTTFAGSLYLTAGLSYGGLSLENCILANVTNLTNNTDFYGSLSGSTNGFYHCPEFGLGQMTNSSYPFQAVGGGDYYLASGCVFTNAGSCNIDPTLLADLATKTTFPPIAYTNVIFTNAMTFNQHAQRDTETPGPDLGYHYDPLDYTFGGCTSESNITFGAGTAVGWFRTTSGWYHAGYGIVLSNTMIATFQGTATAPDYWVRLNTVQENDSSAGYGPGGLVGQDDQNAHDISLSPEVHLFFTRCSMMSGDPGVSFRDDSGYLIVRANDSEFYSRGFSGYVMSSYLTNCLMDHAGVGQDAGYPGNEFTMQNCTFHGGNVNLTPYYRACPQNASSL